LIAAQIQDLIPAGIWSQSEFDAGGNYEFDAAQFRI